MSPPTNPRNPNRSNSNSNNNDSDSILALLLGPSPPAGHGKINTMHWAARHPPKDPVQLFSSSSPLAGKTVVVTGSNTGLGYHAAAKFAALGVGHLILAVRDLTKGEAAKRRILAVTGTQSPITVLGLDMADWASVRTFPRRLEHEVGLSALDVAVLNAGIAPPSYSVNAATGWETALQVNVLSTALLAMKLVPLLQAAAAAGGGPAQLTLTGSFGHLYLTEKDLPSSSSDGLLEQISSPSFFNVQTSYAVLKLLTMYIMQGLIQDFNSDLITINVACPGLCTTDLGRDFPWYVVLPTKLMQLYCARSAEEGSRSLVSATLLGSAGHGKFWTNDVFTEPGVMVTSPEGKRLQAKIWREIVEVCKKEME